MTRRRAIAYGLVLSVALALASARGPWATAEEPAVPEHLAAGAPEPVRCEPEDAVLTTDGRRLLVVCAGAGTLLVLDAATGNREAEIATGEEPMAVVVHPDGRRAYVANRRSGGVAEIDLAAGTVRRHLEAGWGPRGLALNGEGTILYVANLRSDDVSVIDVATGDQIRRIRTGRGPRTIAGNPKDGTLYVGSLYKLRVPFQTTPSGEVTRIDGEAGTLTARHVLPGGMLARGVAVSPDGQMAVVAHVRPRNLVPMTQVQRGWMMTNALSIIGNRPDAEPVAVLLDQPNRSFSDPHGLAFSPDGKRLYVTSLGTHRIAVVDVQRLTAVIESVDPADRETLGDHTGLSREFVIARAPAGLSPAAVVVSRDGERLYVVNRFPDTVTVLDAASLAAAATFDLGYSPVMGHQQWGRQLFHDARFSFQGALACGSCHPEDHYDGLVYDLEPDGLGRDLIDNRSIRGLTGTEPFKWNGKNESLDKQAGPRAANFFLRSTGYREEEIRAVVDYLYHVEPLPNPLVGPDGELTWDQEMGRRIYERTVDNLGRPIPPEGQCAYCHPRPTGTSQMSFDVGTRAPHDTTGVFDTPHLVGIIDSPPYLHDGRCWSLEEIWTVHNPDDRHGVTNDLDKQQLNFLIEYLKTF